MSDKGPVGNWLEQKFLNWQNEQGERRTIVEFAEWLGVSRGTLNNWLRGVRTPEDESVTVLADKLGPEIYDLLGLPRPDPELQAVIRKWGELPEETRRQIRELTDQPYLPEGVKRGRSRRTG